GRRRKPRRRFGPGRAAGQGRGGRRHPCDHEPAGQRGRDLGRAAVRVVVADDSVLFREGLAHLLEGSGFDVRARRGDKQQLLTSVAAERPDLVITDIRMPPTNSVEGLEAAVEIREQYPRMAVLLLSQYVETSHAVRLLERGAAGLGYLLKDRVG